MTASQIMNESIVDDDTVINTITQTVLSTNGNDVSDDDDDDQHDSGINNTTNGHSDFL